MQKNAFFGPPRNGRGGNLCCINKNIFAGECFLHKIPTMGRKHKLPTPRKFRQKKSRYAKKAKNAKKKQKYRVMIYRCF